MPSKDKFHNIVKHSLQKEGWTITADPLYLEVSGVDMYVDLAAEYSGFAMGENEMCIWMPGLWEKYVLSTQCTFN